MYILLYQLDQHLRQIATLIHQAEDPAGAARYSIHELADRAGLRVLVASSYLAPSERLRVAGEEVLDGLRDGLARDDDVEATREAARGLLASLREEIDAFEMGEDYDDGGGEMERVWGAMALR